MSIIIVIVIEGAIIAVVVGIISMGEGGITIIEDVSFMM